MRPQANPSIHLRPTTTPIPDASVRARHSPGGTVTGMDQDTNLLDPDQLDPDLTDGVDAEIVDELLIEEISIDGMCGVY